MQVVNVDDVKIYNLSSGKALPDWLSERKRRSMVKNEASLQKRIQLLQDFEMPTASTKLQLTEDGQYILSAGVYKPRMRCYDVQELSQKFERCMSSEIVQMEVLSQDYSKMIFLQCDRYVELHAKQGFHYRTRIPKFGRDMSYHAPSCDLFLVGASNEVYRLNLEQGQFLAPFVTDAAGINVCTINPQLDVLTMGTSEGRVMVWDPRCRSPIGCLDLAKIPQLMDAAPAIVNALEVTSLRYRDDYHLGVGTSWGQVLLFDIRTKEPYMMKDHHEDLPIKQLMFQGKDDFVLSADTKQLKIWHENTGKQFTTIQPESSINDFAVFPNSGLMLMANEAPRNQVYFIPELGPAPRWCSFLDSLTEEMEETPETTVYDDYKFMTRTELENYGLGHLVGSNLVRPYMHGFFIDHRLYQKAKSIAQPFAYDDFRKQQVTKKMETERVKRLEVEKLPNVNRSLAHRLATESTDPKAKKKKAAGMDSITDDQRFATLFSNPDYQIDENSEEYRLLHPVISKQQEKDMRRKKRLEMEDQDSDFGEDGDDQEEEELEGKASEDESSDEEVQVTNRRQMEKLRHQALAAKKAERNRAKQLARANEKREQQRAQGGQPVRQHVAPARNLKTSSLGARLRMEKEDHDVISTGTSTDGALGGKQITFNVKTATERTVDPLRAHKLERRGIARVGPAAPQRGRGRGRGRGGGRGGGRGRGRGRGRW